MTQAQEEAEELERDERARKALEQRWAAEVVVPIQMDGIDVSVTFAKFLDICGRGKSCQKQLGDGFAALLAYSRLVVSLQRHCGAASGVLNNAMHMYFCKRARLRGLPKKKEFAGPGVSDKAVQMYFCKRARLYTCTFAKEHDRAHVLLQKSTTV
jgi:hypothetical protein